MQKSHRDLVDHGVRAGVIAERVNAAASERCYNTKEAAALLGCSAKTVLARIARGDISPVFRRGRRGIGAITIPESAIETHRASGLTLRPHVTLDALAAKLDEMHRELRALVAQRVNTASPSADVLSVAEFASEAGRSSDWVYDQIRLRRVRPLRLGKPFQLPRSELLRLRDAKGGAS